MKNARSQTSGTSALDKRNPNTDSPRRTTNPPRPFRFTANLPELMADTAHLEPVELGSYMRLLFSYWRVGPAKNDDRTLARIVGLPVKEWVAIRPEIEPFFDIEREWIHWRQDAEIEAAYAAINANRLRTEAATAARKQRGAQRNVARHVERHVARNDTRHDERYEVPTEIQATPPSQADDFQIPEEWKDALCAAEDGFLGGEQ